jgi:excisionase family DNA binding protein
MATKTEQKQDTMPDLSIKDLAALVGKHEVTLRRLARNGELPGAYKVGRDWRISQQAADRLRGLS